MAKQQVFRLTEQACMAMALEDFGIDVSLAAAKAIKDRFVELMVKAGHIEQKESEA